MIEVWSGIHKVKNFNVGVLTQTFCWYEIYHFVKLQFQLFYLSTSQEERLQCLKKRLDVSFDISRADHQVLPLFLSPN